MEIFTGKNSDAVAAWAGDALTNFLLQKADKPTLLLLSGGSSLEVVKHMNPNILRSNLSFGLVDERFGVHERDRNLTAILKTPFVKSAQKQGRPITAIEATSGSVQESASRYEAYLKQWRVTFRDSVIAAVLGIGADGHVAGVMPFPGDRAWFEDTFANSRKWVVGYDTKGVGDFPQRVTVTPYFLNQEVDYAIAFACGRKKRAALERTTAVDGTLSETPARVLITMKESYLCTDAL